MYSTPLKKYLCGVASVVLTASLNAQQSYLWHEKSPLALGKGVEPLALFAQMLYPVELDQPERLDATGQTSEFREVRSEADFLSAQAMDFGIEARYKMVHGNLNTASSSMDFYSSDSFNWFAKVTLDFGRFEIRNPRLTTNALNVLAQNNPALFREKFGTQFIRAERRQAVFTATFSVNHVSSEAIHTFPRGSEDWW